MVFDINTAKDISKWLLDNTELIPENNNRIVAQINYLQIIKRIRVLDKREKEILYKILDMPTCSDINKAGIYILFDNKERVNYYLDKLDTKEKEYFQTFPIYNLQKKKKDLTYFS